MAGISLEQLVKRYPNGFEATKGVSLEITDGEFMVLVGPSGCGKSTLLRMIAGLEEVTEGTILIGDRDVTDLPPKDRDIAMVFQNYALYPHMSVEQNLGFGLKLRKTPKPEIQRRVGEVAGILGLETMLKRKPAQLSGGQRQRVAMGRAMVREPQAFLMDEPLSNLDAKLRVQMRAELAKLRDRLRTTTVYVTHDQVEAMTLGDRVAVLRDGVLQQCDTPQVLFRKPVNLFVAAFIGSPSMNLVEAVYADGHVSFAGFRIPISSREGLSDFEGKSLILGIRPTDFEDAANARDQAQPTMTVTPTVTEELGSEIHVHFDIDAPPVSSDDIKAAADEEGDEDMRLIRDDDLKSAFTARVDAASSAKPGQPLLLAIDSAALHVFDPASGLAIGAREPALVS